jgi:hypothetical protein
MKQFRLFFATLGLTCFALLPATSLADGLEDLEVTMAVIESMDGIDVAISEMRGPESNDDVNDDVGGDGEVGEDDHEEAESDLRSNARLGRREQPLHRRAAV